VRTTFTRSSSTAWLGGALGRVLSERQPSRKARRRGAARDIFSEL
jgi:hypothetical protein